MNSHDLAREVDVRDVFERYVNALNGRRLDEIAAVVGEQVEHNGDKMSRDAWWADRVAANIAAVPDLRWNVDDVVVTGDRICVRYTDTGSPVETFAGCEPTGGRLAFSEYCFYRVSAGRIVETWGLVDEASIRHQMQTGPR